MVWPGRHSSMSVWSEQLKIKHTNGRHPYNTFWFTVWKMYFFNYYFLFNFTPFAPVVVRPETLCSCDPFFKAVSCHCVVIPPCVLWAVQQPVRHSTHTWRSQRLRAEWSETWSLSHWSWTIIIIDDDQLDMKLWFNIIQYIYESLTREHQPCYNLLLLCYHLRSNQPAGQIKKCYSVPAGNHQKYEGKEIIN